MTKVKTTELPNRAKDLYIQLYCEKKGGKTSANKHNAAQSWLSLSLTKKQHFYDTISSKYSINKAQRIIQTEPYLNRRFSNITKLHHPDSNQNNGEPEAQNTTIDDIITSVHDDTSINCNNSSNSCFEENNVNGTLPLTEILDTENNTMQEGVEECMLDQVQNENLPLTEVLDTENNTLQDRVEECLLDQVQNEPQICNVQNLQKSYMSIVDDDTDSVPDNHKGNHAEYISLLAPALPTVKTGKDLFELLKSRNGINKDYGSLTSREKNYYGRAALAIKKDYVKRFKEYLESLSPRQLYDYYMKMF